MSTRSPVMLRRIVICLALSAALVLPAVGTASAEVARQSKCQKPSGEPIPLATIGTFEGPGSQTRYDGASKAAVKSINCAGGVQGRPLDLNLCNSNPLVDPNLGQKCVREVIADNVVASVSGNSLDESVIPSLDAAGIPSVGSAFVVQGLLRPTFFNITGGVPAVEAGLAAKLYDDGARKIRVVSLDVPNAAALISLADLGLETRGTKTIEPVLFPLDPSVDDSALVQAAVTDADALILLVTDEVLAKILPEILGAGYKGKIGIGASTILPTAKDVQRKGIVFATGLYPPSAKDHKAIRDFNADMKKYGPKLDRPLLEADVQAWLAVYIVADALEKAETIDAAGLLEVLNTYVSPFDAGPPLDFSKTGALGVPRLFTSTIVPLKLVKKDYVQDGPILDPTLPPSSGSTTTTAAK